MIFSSLKVARRLALTFLLVIVAGTAAAQSSPGTAGQSLPGNSPGEDPASSRSRVNVSQPPWRSVGKLQAVAGSLRTTCTGALVGPRTVLSAAHCLFNVRTQRVFLASSLHFLLGFEGETYEAAADVVEMLPSPGYDFSQPGETRGSDWALADARYARRRHKPNPSDFCPACARRHPNHDRWICSG